MNPMWDSCGILLGLHGGESALGQHLAFNQIEMNLTELERVWRSRRTGQIIVITSNRNSIWTNEPLNIELGPYS